jgi:hypothetical protein
MKNHKQQNTHTQAQHDTLVEWMKIKENHHNEALVVS